MENNQQKTFNYSKVFSEKSKDEIVHRMKYFIKYCENCLSDDSIQNKKLNRLLSDIKYALNNYQNDQR